MLINRQKEVRCVDYSEIKDIPEYKDLNADDLNAYIKEAKGCTIRDFCFAVPRKFPKTGVYSQSRVEKLPHGNYFVKKYTLRGDFKAGDDDERIFLANYWRVIGNGQKKFRFSLINYLDFKGVDVQQSAKDKVTDFLCRTIGNKWETNCLFNYQTKEFESHESFGIIEDLELYVARNANNRRRKLVIEMEWSDRYFEILKSEKNLKYFDMNVYSQISDKSQMTRRLYHFLENSSSSYNTKFKDHRKYQIEIKTLCHYFLAVPSKRSISEYKKTLARPLENLKELGLLKFDKVSDCFEKYRGNTYVKLKFIPKKNRSQAKEPSHQEAKAKKLSSEYLSDDNYAYYQKILDTLESLDIDHATFEKSYLDRPLVEADLKEVLKYLLFIKSAPEHDIKIETKKGAFKAMCDQRWEFPDWFREKWKYFFREIQYQLKRNELFFFLSFQERIKLIEEKLSQIPEFNKLKIDSQVSILVNIKKFLKESGRVDLLDINWKLTNLIREANKE